MSLYQGVERNTVYSTNCRRLQKYIYSNKNGSYIRNKMLYLVYIVYCCFNSGCGTAGLEIQAKAIDRNCHRSSHCSFQIRDLQWLHELYTVIACENQAKTRNTLPHSNPTNLAMDPGRFQESSLLSSSCGTCLPNVWPGQVALNGVLSGAFGFDLKIKQNQWTSK